MSKAWDAHESLVAALGELDNMDAEYRVRVAQVRELLRELADEVWDDVPQEEKPQR